MGRPARIRSSLGGLLLAVAASGTVAAAQETRRSIQRSPGNGPIGTEIAVSGQGCIEGGRADETAHIALVDDRGSEYGFYRAKAPIAADGTFEGTITVPDEATPGPHTIAVDCQEGDRLKEAGQLPFRVDAPRTPAPTRTPAPPSPTRSAFATATPAPSPAASPRRPPRWVPPTRAPAPTSTTTPTPSPTRTTTRALPPPTRVATSPPSFAAAPDEDRAPGRSGAGAGAAAAALVLANATGLLLLRRTASPHG